MTPNPNPEVYRTAAAYIASKRADYSCAAVSLACDHFRLTYRELRMHRLQYYAALGCYPGRVKSISVDSLLDYDPTLGPVPWFDHPFWNHASHDPECREYRILALLFMAELVANP